MRDRTTHHSDYMTGKVEKLRFWKKWTSKCGWNNYSDKSLWFRAETFFQRSLESFLWTLWTCSRYLKGHVLDLCVSKKIVIARHKKKMQNPERKKNDVRKLPFACNVFACNFDKIPSKKDSPTFFAYFLKSPVEGCFVRLQRKNSSQPEPRSTHVPSPKNCQDGLWTINV